MRKYLARGLAGAALATSTVVTVAPTAHANDLTLTWTNPTTGFQYKGRWTDLTDTLCARTQGFDLRVRIFPADGSGPEFSKTTTDGGGGNWGAWQCTGNLSIPEDELYRMRLIMIDSGTETVLVTDNFYT